MSVGITLSYLVLYPHAANKKLLVPDPNDSKWTFKIQIFYQIILMACWKSNAALVQAGSKRSGGS